MRLSKIPNAGPSNPSPSPLSPGQLRILLSYSISMVPALRTSRLWSPHSSSARRSTTPCSPRSFTLTTLSCQITTLLLRAVNQSRSLVQIGNMMSSRDGAVIPIFRSAPRGNAATATLSGKPTEIRHSRTKNKTENMKITKLKKAKSIWIKTSKPFAKAVPNVGSG